MSLLWPRGVIFHQIYIFPNGITILRGLWVANSQVLELKTRQFLQLNSMCFVYLCFAHGLIVAFICFLMDLRITVFLVPMQCIIHSTGVSPVTGV